MFKLLLILLLFFSCFGIFDRVKTELKRDVHFRAEPLNGGPVEVLSLDSAYRVGDVYKYDSATYYMLVERVK